MPNETIWMVYILRCSDRTLYTGVTTDPVRRLKQHNAGTGARYTRARLPVTQVYLEEVKREYAIKKMTRIQKLGLIMYQRNRS